MSSSALKLIAAILMVLSHTGSVLSPFLPADAVRLLVILGRPAFPVFVFFLAQGWEHTRSQKKYLIRLGAFALISHIPFAAALFPDTPLYAAPTSVIATLFLAATGMYLLDRGKSNRLWLIASMLTAVLAYALKTDYGAIGVITALGAYAVKEHRLRPVVIGAGMALFYLSKGISVWTVTCLLASLVGAAALYVCNGRRDGAIRTGRYFFYWFYPLHLSLLIIIRYILGGKLL